MGDSAIQYSLPIIHKDVDYRLNEVKSKFPISNHTLGIDRSVSSSTASSTCLSAYLHFHPTEQVHRTRLKEREPLLQGNKKLVLIIPPLE